jgi:manganese/zinc/iron transport system substrate-binding protein
MLMTHICLQRLIAPLLVLAAVVLTGCGTPVVGAEVTQLTIGDRAIRVVATTGHIADAVRNVGGERVEVTALMGPGVDPHLYKATARDVIAIENADVVFYNGLELEGRMTEIFERLAQTRPVYAVSESIPADRLRPSDEYENAHDPHIWFDPTIWSYAVDEVARRLTQLDPSYESLYESHAARYKEAIAELDRYAREQIERIPPQSRVLITAHDAFGYFGDHYGFEVRGLQGISTASEAGAADVQRLAQFIVDRQIRAIFVESSVPQATVRAVQEAVRARGGEVTIGGELFSDALGAEGTPEGAYLGMFRYNVDTIVAALAGL